MSELSYRSDDGGGFDIYQGRYCVGTACNEDVAKAMCERSQGGEAVAWSWVSRGRHVTVDKSHAEELRADGELVVPLYTHSSASVPNAMVALVAICQHLRDFVDERGTSIVCHRGVAHFLDALNDAEAVTEQALAATPQPVVPEGWEILPEDLRTHLGDFKEAVKSKAQEEAEEYLDDDYWCHQLRVIENIEQKISEGPQPPREQEPGHE